VTFLAPVLPKQTERSFQAQVVKLAELLGWRCYHTLRSEGSAAGFPDLVLVRARHPKPRVIFAELKADRGRLTDDQKTWLLELRACGQEAYLWAPRHWSAITSYSGKEALCDRSILVSLRVGGV
jgi:hypothetical protein